MYRTAKSLELVEVEVYGCFIYYSYLFLHKTFILCNVVLTENKDTNTLPIYKTF